MICGKSCGTAMGSKSPRPGRLPPPGWIDSQCSYSVRTLGFQDDRFASAIGPTFPFSAGSSTPHKGAVEALGEYPVAFRCLFWCLEAQMKMSRTTLLTLATAGMIAGSLIAGCDNDFTRGVQQKCANAPDVKACEDAEYQRLYAI